MNRSDAKIYLRSIIDTGIADLFLLEKCLCLFYVTYKNLVGLHYAFVNNSRLVGLCDSMLELCIK